MKKLSQDSTATFKPIIHQFIVALESCFELVENESVYIEKFGDITVSRNYQIEVKDCIEPLTDCHENLWKTIKNWLTPDFDVVRYKKLILLTTQTIGNKSKLEDWNSKESTQKRQILQSIFDQYQRKKEKSEKTVELLNSVLCLKNQDKLDTILGKFVIVDSSAKDEKRYEIIKQKHCKVLSINKDKFIDSLLGYIISPPVTSSNWEISYDAFSARIASLVEEFSSTTKIFPKRYSGTKVSTDEQTNFEGYRFVTKIKDIGHYDAIGDAITDFVNTRKTIAEELAQHQIAKQQYESYENELFTSYKTNYRRASRNSSKDTIERDSQNFYDSITASPVPNFRNFNDTPLFFRNGLLHEISNSTSDERSLIWRLEVKDD